MSCRWVASCSGNLVRLILVVLWPIALWPQSPLSPAMQEAAAKGDVARIRQLLAAGESPDARDAKGRTALMVAAGGGFGESAEALLDAGADPNLAADNGLTALMYGAFQGRQSAVELLLTRGADRWLSGPNGATASDFARQAGHGQLADFIDSFVVSTPDPLELPDHWLDPATGAAVGVDASAVDPFRGETGVWTGAYWSCATTDGVMLVQEHTYRLTWVPSAPGIGKLELEVWSRELEPIPCRDYEMGQPEGVWAGQATFTRLFRVKGIRHDPSGTAEASIETGAASEDCPASCGAPLPPSFEGFLVLAPDRRKLVLKGPPDVIGVQGEIDLEPASPKD